MKQRYANENPVKHTAEFWEKEFREAMCGPDEKLTYEHWLRYKYWTRRAHLWDYLANLCNEKGFTNDK